MPSPPSSADLPAWSDFIGARIDCGEMPSSQQAILNGFRTLCDALYAARVMTIIVVFVDSDDGFRNIKHGHLVRECIPDKPVVPSRTADGEWRHISKKHAAEGEEVD